MSSADDKEEESETMFQGAGCREICKFDEKGGISDPK